MLQSLASRHWLVNGFECRLLLLFEFMNFPLKFHERELLGAKIALDLGVHLRKFRSMNFAIELWR